MMKPIVASTVAVGLGLSAFSLAFAQTTNTPSAGAKLSQAQCETLWSQALANKPGDLGMEQAKPYVKDFTKADKDGNGKLTQAEWTNACNQGWIQTSASTGAGSGASGTSDRTPGASSTPKAPTPSRPY